MNLYFQHSNGDLSLIEKDVLDIDCALKKIASFLKDRNYKSYYTRYWYNEEETEVTFDVGSHTEFFKLEEE